MWQQDLQWFVSLEQHSGPRWRQKECYRQGAIVEEELGKHVAFGARVTADVVGDAKNVVLEPPAWLGPATSAALATSLEAALAPANDQLDNIESRLGNIEARQNNAVANEYADTLKPLLNADGGIYSIFDSIPSYFPITSRCGNLLKSRHMLPLQNSVD
ncbi:unnamed protein product [Cylindrotheca closterium]|uniref:Uncharacterized protein n=1 Tax=Cylindrotheca closterium TaxID=2856 RepID=A0AAD2JGT6_9STRA|nr:unnamed protein product [Cylindrotheca closterium]